MAYKHLTPDYVDVVRKNGLNLKGTVMPEMNFTRVVKVPSSMVVEPARSMLVGTLSPVLARRLSLGHKSPRYSASSWVQR